LIRKKNGKREGDIAQLVERCPCKADASGSSPLISTRTKPLCTGVEKSALALPTWNSKKNLIDFILEKVF
jgi:hypothetical protein